MSERKYSKKPFRETFRKIDEYISRNYQNRLRNLTTRNYLPTDSSVGIELTVEAIKKISLEENLSALELAIKIDKLENFWVFGLDGDWDTFNGLEEYFKEQ